MSTPGFTAESSIYTSEIRYRPAVRETQGALRAGVIPQKITCYEFECGEVWKNVPGYCVRCDSDRLK